MKPEIAKEKWCFAVKFSNTGISSRYVEDLRFNEACKCIAKDCMAWRYHDTSPAGICDGDGYCGLAGDKNYA